MKLEKKEIPQLKLKIMKKEFDCSEMDTVIDRHNLDQELINQANLFRRYAQLHVLATMEADFAKARLDNAKAEVAKEIREEREAKKEKCTEQIIKDEVCRHARVIAANKDYIERKAMVGQAKAYADSMVQKGRSMDSLNRRIDARSNEVMAKFCD